MTYFNKFGEVPICTLSQVYGVSQVLEIVLMKDHQTGSSRGFGFVTFKDTAAADECVKEARYHNIDDKQVCLLCLISTGRTLPNLRVHYRILA